MFIGTVAPSHAPVPRPKDRDLLTGDPYDPTVIAARLEAGRRAELTADALPPDLVGRPAPSYFRTYEQLKDALYGLQAKYPDLVEVRDIGDTAEKLAGKADRDILALVISNKTLSSSTPEERPTTLHVGGIHAREIANPELLMTFATQLLEGYGRDADATMTVDGGRTILVPMLNPDGHAVVEKGFAGDRGGNTMQRKSTAAGDPSLGVDLNRNFDYHWGGPGASGSPRSETYRGPAASSEPETKAIDRFVAAIKPDFFVDWHSYSKLNMYPWGDTKAKTKDHEAFRAIAQKYTTYNGYSPIQAIELYPTTGTTDDTMYGKYGVPSMAIETGSTFHQSDSEFQGTLKANLPVLKYTSKIAADPFKLVFGPDVLALTVDAGTRAVSARISDVNNGKQALAGAELVADPNAAPGTGIQLQAADGAFNSPDEQVVGDAAALSGQRLLYVRGRDVQGNWGPLTAQWVTAPSA